jgi:hypothetical protein
MALYTDNCIIRAVTLAPNEPFNLPAGAEIISVTDINSLKSTCPIPSDLEELECYILSFVALDDDGDRPPYNGSDTSSQKTFYIRGVQVGNIFYSLSTAVTAGDNGVFNIGPLVTFMQTTPGLAGLFLDITTAGASVSNKGGIATMCFKAVPSIAANTFIAADTAIIGLNNDNPDTFIRIYPIKRTDWSIISQDGTGICQCLATPVTT